MDESAFTRELSGFRDRMVRLMERLEAADMRDLAESVLQELEIALEELNVAEAEIAEQQQQLVDVSRALEVEHRRYVELFEDAPDGYLVTDTEGVILEANRAAARLLGVGQDTLAGRPVAAFVARRAQIDLFLGLARLEGGDQSTMQEWELSLQPRDGDPFLAALSVVAGREDDGSTKTLRWLIRDISRRNEMAVRLGEYSQRLKALDEIDRAVLDLSSAETLAQRALAHIMDLVPCRWASVALFDRPVQEMWLVAAREAAGTEPDQATEDALGSAPQTGWRGPLADLPGLDVLEAGVTYRTRDLSRLPTGSPIARALLRAGVRGYTSVPLIAREVLTGSLNLGFVGPPDLTADQGAVVQEMAHRLAAGLHYESLREDAEHEAEDLRDLMETEKLILTARLAGAFAHEVSNPLQTVVGCMSLAQEAATGGECGNHYLQVAQEELRRAVDMVARFRDVGRQVLDEEKVLVDINESVDSALVGMRTRCEGLGVELVWHPEEGIPPVWMAPALMQRVFLNLILNAIDAMPQEGTLEVSTSFRMDSGEACVRFVDSGHGVDPDVFPHLFEPFTTTKPDGMGLGLYVSQNVVSQHGGRIEVESQPGQGAAFAVWLSAGARDKPSGEEEAMQGG